MFLRKKVTENGSPGHRKSIESIALRIVCKIVSKVVDKNIMYIIV